MYSPKGLTHWEIITDLALASLYLSVSVCAWVCVCVSRCLLFVVLFVIGVGCPLRLRLVWCCPILYCIDLI